MTVRDIVYMILDELKVQSDDSYFEEEHIVAQIVNYRAFLLKQKYSDIKKYIPESNYQTLCLDLEQVPAITGEACEGGYYLRSTAKVPFPMNSSTIRVTPLDFFGGDISYVSRERLRYIGHNRFTKNLLYCALGPDEYLYFKSDNPQFLYLEKVRMTAVFSDFQQAWELSCNKDGEKVCDILDAEFPLENSLIPVVIEMTVKELIGAIYRPKDDTNNAHDDLSDVAKQPSK